MKKIKQFLHDILSPTIRVEKHYYETNSKQGKDMEKVFEKMEAAFEEMSKLFKRL